MVIKASTTSLEQAVVEVYNSKQCYVDKAKRLKLDVQVIIKGRMVRKWLTLIEKCWYIEGRSNNNSINQVIVEEANNKDDN